MTAAKIEQLRQDVEELTKLSEIATRQRVKDILIIDVRKLETEISYLRQKLEKEEAEARKEAPSTSIVPNTVKCYNVKINNYCWDQNPRFVKVIVSLPDVEKLPKENVTCDFTSRSMVLYVNGLGNRNYHLPLLNLCKNIDPERSEFKIKPGTVIINLSKATATEQWPDVLASKKPNLPNVPNMEISEDPSKSLMTMVKQLYEDGDDDMKRTIAKAWTSNRADALSQ